MIKAYSATATLAATGYTTLLTRDVPKGKEWKILEIRLPASVMTRAVMTVFIKSQPIHQLVPTPFDNAYLIGDTFREETDFVFSLEKLDATETTIGVTIIVDETGY
jgi:hypothetical protein